MTGVSTFALPVTRVTLAYSPPGTFSTADFEIARRTVSLSLLSDRSSRATAAIRSGKLVFGGVMFLIPAKACTARQFWKSTYRCQFAAAGRRLP